MRTNSVPKLKKFVPAEPARSVASPYFYTGIPVTGLSSPNDPYISADNFWWPFVSEDAVSKLPDSAKITYLPTSMNVTFSSATEYVNNVLHSGDFLKSYLDANLILRELNPQASSIMEHDLDRLEASHVEQLDNIREFRASTLKVPIGQRTVEEKNQSLLAQVEAPSFGSIGSLILEEVEDFAYWRKVRDSLRDTFSLSLETLAEAIGVAYATFVNLGKSRPKEPTVAKVVRLYEHARALKSADPIAAADWLRGAGAALLREKGLEAFVQTVQAQLFNPTTMRVPAAVVDGVDDADAAWTYDKAKPLSDRRSGGERF